MLERNPRIQLRSEFTAFVGGLDRRKVFIGSFIRIKPFSDIFTQGVGSMKQGELYIALALRGVLFRSFLCRVRSSFISIVLHRSACFSITEIDSTWALSEHVSRGSRTSVEIDLYHLQEARSGKVPNLALNPVFEKLGPGLGMRIAVVGGDAARLPSGDHREQRIIWILQSEI